MTDPTRPSEPRRSDADLAAAEQDAVNEAIDEVGANDRTTVVTGGMGGSTGSETLSTPLSEPAPEDFEDHSAEEAAARRERELEEAAALVAAGKGPTASRPKGRRRGRSTAVTDSTVAAAAPGVATGPGDTLPWVDDRASRIFVPLLVGSFVALLLWALLFSRYSVVGGDPYPPAPPSPSGSASPTSTGSPAATPTGSPAASPSGSPSPSVSASPTGAASPSPNVPASPTGAASPSISPSPTAPSAPPS
jgi:hypothetical protein